MQETQTKLVGRYLLYSVATISIAAIFTAYAAPEKLIRVLEVLPVRALVLFFSFSFFAAAAAFIWNLIFIRSTVSLLQKTLRAITFITTLAGAGTLVGFPTIDAQVAAERHTVEIDFNLVQTTTTSASLQVFVFGILAMIILVLFRFIIARDIRDRGPLDIGLD